MMKASRFGFIVFLIFCGLGFYLMFYMSKTTPFIEKYNRDKVLFKLGDSLYSYKLDSVYVKP